MTAHPATGTRHLVKPHRKPTLKFSLGNPRAISLPAFLLSIPIGLVATFAASRTPFSSLAVAALWGCVAVLSHGALGAVLLGGNRIIRGLAPESLKARVSVIGITVLASAARGAVIAGCARLWDLSPTASYEVRILSSSLIFTAWLTIIGALLAAQDRYRAELEILLADVVSSDLHSRRLESTVSNEHTMNAVKRVVEKVAPLRLALKHVGSKSAYQRTAAVITAAIAEHLSPLSQELSGNKEPYLWRSGVTQSFMVRVLNTPVPYHRALPLMTMFLVVNAYVWHGGIGGLLQGFLAGVIAALIVIPFTIWGRSRRVLSNGAMYGALFLLPATIVQFSFATSGGFEPIFLVMAFGIPLAFLLGAAAQTVAGDRESNISQLREAIAGPDWETHLDLLHRLESELSVARFLHDTVQSRLKVATLQLLKAAEDDDAELAESAISLALSVIALAPQRRGGAPWPGEKLRRLGEAPYANASSRLSAFSGSWRGVANVSLLFEGVSGSDSMAADPGGSKRLVAWSLLAEAVEGCVTNAILQRAASEVRVTCRQAKNEVQAIITDNGHWSRGHSPAQRRDSASHQTPGIGIGIGMSWAQSISDGDWNVKVAGGETTLTLRVPIC